ncbi:MAG: flavodoxin family protein [Candidatus Omnitrophota bacterium]
MKALIVYGSPHGKNSATYRLGSSFANGLNDQGWTIDELMINDADINHCRGCYICWMKTPGICVQKDGMTEIIERHKHIDLLILAAPLYFFSIPGKVKDYWDRNMPLYFTEYQKMSGQAANSWTDDFKFLLISTCGFPQKDAFDGLITSAKKIYGPAYWGEMLVPLASGVSRDSNGTKYPELYDFFYNAGKEYGDQRILSNETLNTLEFLTSAEKMNRSA